MQNKPLFRGALKGEPDSPILLELKEAKTPPRFRKVDYSVHRDLTSTTHVPQVGVNALSGMPTDPTMSSADSGVASQHSGYGLIESSNKYQAESAEESKPSRSHNEPLQPGVNLELRATTTHATTHTTTHPPTHTPSPTHVANIGVNAPPSNIIPAGTLIPPSDFDPTPAPITPINDNVTFDTNTTATAPPLANTPDATPTPTIPKPPPIAPVPRSYTHPSSPPYSASPSSPGSSYSSGGSYGSYGSYGSGSGTSGGGPPPPPPVPLVVVAPVAGCPDTRPNTGDACTPSGTACDYDPVCCPKADAALCTNVSHITCGDDGKWGNLQQASIACPQGCPQDLPTPGDSCSPTYLFPGDWCNYDLICCPRGYPCIHSHHIQCNDAGLWTQIAQGDLRCPQQPPSVGGGSGTKTTTTTKTPASTSVPNIPVWEQSNQASGNPDYTTTTAPAPPHPNYNPPSPPDSVPLPPQPQLQPGCPPTLPSVGASCAGVGSFTECQYDLFCCPHDPDSCLNISQITCDGNSNTWGNLQQRAILCQQGCPENVPTPGDNCNPTYVSVGVRCYYNLLCCPAGSPCVNTTSIECQDDGSWSKIAEASLRCGAYGTPKVTATTGMGGTTKKQTSTQQSSTPSSTSVSNIAVNNLNRQWGTPPPFPSTSPHATVKKGVKPALAYSTPTPAPAYGGANQPRFAEREEYVGLPPPPPPHSAPRPTPTTTKVPQVAAAHGRSDYSPYGPSRNVDGGYDTTPAPDAPDSDNAPAPPPPEPTLTGCPDNVPNPGDRCTPTYVSIGTWCNYNVYCCPAGSPCVNTTSIECEDTGSWSKIAEASIRCPPPVTPPPRVYNYRAEVGAGKSYGGANQPRFRKVEGYYYTKNTPTPSPTHVSQIAVNHAGSSVSPGALYPVPTPPTFVGCPENVPNPGDNCAPYYVHPLDWCYYNPDCCPDDGPCANTTSVQCTTGGGWSNSVTVPLHCPQINRAGQGGSHPVYEGANRPRF